MARGNILLSNEFEGDGRIIGDDMLLCSPPEVALQADKGTVDRGRFLSLHSLQIGPIPCECWCGDSLHGKAIVDMRFLLRFVPGDEVTQIAQVIANGGRCEIFSLAQPMLIGSKCLVSSR